MSQGYLEIDDARFWGDLQAALEARLLAEFSRPQALELGPTTPRPAPRSQEEDVEDEEEEDEEDEEEEHEGEDPGLPEPFSFESLATDPEPEEAEEPEEPKEPLRLVLDAPRRVALGTRETLPAVAARIGSSAELLAFDLGSRGLLVAIDQLSGELRWGVLGREDAPPPTLKPGVKPAPGREAESIVLEARHKLRLPWRSGVVRLYALAREHLSEACEVRLEADGFDDPEVARFVAERRQASAPDRVSPFANARRPRYQALADSPPLPEGLGVAFSVPRVQLIEETRELRLYGSFRLEAHELDRARTEVEVRGLPPGPQPSAVLPITLLVVGSRSKTPTILRLRVPSFDPLPAGVAGARVSGYFELDLQRGTTLGGAPETLFVYAFARGVASGPELIGLVSREMIDGAPSDPPAEEDEPLA